MAAQNGHSNAVTMLLTLGAKMTQNSAERYFLDLAIQNEHKEVCVAVVSHDRCGISRQLYLSFFVDFQTQTQQSYSMSTLVFFWK